MAKEAPSIDKGIIKQVAEAAGWIQLKAKRELSNAQQMGISPKQYLKKKCWEKSPDEMAALSERLEQQRQLRAEQAQELSNVAGCSIDEAARKIREAKNYGVDFDTYMQYRGYDLSLKDLSKLGMVVEAFKRRRSDNISYMLDMTVEKSGWTRSYVKSQLKEAKEMGINRLNYFWNSCWSMDESQLEECAKLCSALSDSAKSKRDKCMNYIIEQTEWNEGTAEFKVSEAFADSGCSIEDYARCRMWELTKEQQRTFLNSMIFRKFRIENNDFELGSPIFDYKDAFEDVFSDLISRRHFAFDGMSKGDFFNNIRGLTQIVVKPVRGSYGRDIEILPCNEGYLQNGELYQRLADFGKPLVIEEKIEQCDVLNELCPTSVNTLRVVTLRIDDNVHVLQCVLRCGVGAVVDNIHSGGLVIEVDPVTGVCKGDAVDYFGDTISNHPITGVAFKGLRIPNIADVLTLAEAAAKVVPECKLIGWDIAVTQDGADLVEGNLKADYDAGQMAHLGVDREEGLRQTMVAPYVNPSDLGHSYLDDIIDEAKDAESIDQAEFKFSVVMPVYKAEKYLKDVMDSLIEQTIGFEENIQVILVNDGSPDDSAKICAEYAEQYPDNVVFVDKENGGPSSARNAGIPYVKGAFINFLDPDDVWSTTAFKHVWNLVRKHKGEVDVIGCRQKFFEAKSGYHQLDYKFKFEEPYRVVSINTNPDFVQLSATSAFIAASAFKRHTFDERISLGDDSKLLTEVILDKGRYGLCKRAIHHFRKREDDSSITQNKSQNKMAFTGTIKHYYTFIADYSIEKFGRVIPYIQHCLINGLKYRAGKPLPEVLDDGEKKTYKDAVIGLIKKADDGVLLRARNASSSLKLYMLHLKTGIPMKDIPQIIEGSIWVDGGRAFKLTGNGDLHLESISIDDGILKIEGNVRIPGYLKDYGLFCDVDENVSEIEIDQEPSEEQIGITDEVFSERHLFTVEIPIEGSEAEIHLFANYDEEVVCLPITVEEDGDAKVLKDGELELDGHTIFLSEDKKMLAIKRLGADEED